MISAVCAALLAVQTALSLWGYGAYAEESAAVLSPDEGVVCECDGLLSSAFDFLAGERESFFDGLRFGQSDRAAYCRIRLYGERPGEFAEEVLSSAEELIGSEGFVPPTELQRAAIVLSGYGGCPRELINAAVYDNTDLDRQGLNAWIWALTAANCSGMEAEEGALNTHESIAEHIAAAALEDGGFNLRGEGADCDITAAAVYALAPLEDNHGIKAVLDGAVGCLGNIQLESGGFASMGIENCESAAQALIAFTAAGYGREDERVSRALSAMLEYRVDGGFAHTPGGDANAMATAQAAEALTALALRERGERLYDFCGGNAAESAETAEEPPCAISGITAEETAVSSAETGAPSFGGFHIKLIISAVSGVTALTVLIYGAARRKKAPIAAAAAAAVISGAVWMLDIKTPSEYYSAEEPGDFTVTVSAECPAALAAMERIDESINPASVIPEDGVIIAECAVSLKEGNTAFDALAAAAREHRVRVDYTGSAYGVYIRGIGYVLEFGFGDMSGWLYRVNGESPDVSAGAYVLSDGDVVEFIYTV